MELKKVTLFLKQHPFLWISIMIFTVIFLPILSAAFSVTEKGSQWDFVLEYRLWTYFTQSLTLVIGVLVISTFLGVYAASVVSLYEFKGRKLLSLLLFLPLSMPSYVMAFIYQDIVSTEFSMSLQHLLGAILILSMTLYPYIYLTTKSQFKYLNQSLEDASKLMKMSSFKRMMFIHLPILKPGIITGMMFVLFETMNDYGTVSYFNVKVLSVGIFETWFSLNDRLSGLRLSFIYVFIVVLVMSILSFKKSRIISMHRPSTPWRKMTLNNKQYVYKVMPLWIWIMLSLMTPLLYLMLEMIKVVSTVQLDVLLGGIFNTLWTGSMAAFIILGVALILVNANRFYAERFVKMISKIALIGYVLPGVLIALMYYVWFVALDQWLQPFYLLMNQQGLILSLSVMMLLSALVMRFLSVGYHHLDSHYKAIGTHHTLTSYMLKKSKIKTLFQVDIPMIKWGLWTGFLLVLVDILKELPMTLILRPFNYHSLSTLIYQYVMDEQLAMASAASLVLVILAALLMVLVHHIGGKRHVS